MGKSKQLSISNEMKIDVHCHLFNKTIASIPLLIDIIKILTEKKERDNVRNFEANSSNAHKSTIKRIIKLLKMVFSHDEKSLLDYMKKYEKNTIFVPLMFDLKYAVTSKDALKELQNMKEELQNELNATAEGGVDTTLFQANVNEDEFDVFFNEIDEFIGEIEDENDVLENESNNNFKDASNKLFHKHRPQKDTFDKQYKQILDLKKANPDIIKPFFVVDSRRKNVFQLMKKALEKDGFAGVKIYCPNGYSPLDPKLDEVYEYCCKNDVPITAHCSYGGFATLENTIEVDGYIFKDNKVTAHKGQLRFKKSIKESGGIEERALALNHPLLWNEVLIKHKGLKLNLAHIGIRGHEDIDKRYEWSNIIIDMMLKHENLYTDFSCITEERQINQLWSLLSEADKRCNTTKLKVTDRVMFGTDFWLSMIFEDLGSYMEHFESVFAEKQNDLNRIQQTNPRRFLNNK